MKSILPAFSLLLLFASTACSGSKETVYDAAQERESALIDSLSNYPLFDYVESLEAEDYYALLDSVKNGTSEDFFTLRMAYTKTEEYSPYGIMESTLFLEIQKLIEASEYEEALSMLNGILDENYVKTRAHLYCGYIYEQMEDDENSEFHYDIYQGLMYSIYESGDGLLPETAYIVINTNEEYDFLSWYSLTPAGQSLIHKDGFNFDLMKARDQESGDEQEIYFNVSLAFRQLSN